MEDKEKQQIPPEPPSEADIINSKKENMQYLKDKGQNPYKYSFDRTGSVAEVLKRAEALVEGVDSTVEERIAGRLVSVRSHGKSAFAHIKDFSGKMQVYFKKDVLGEDLFNDFKKFDIGDIIGVTGILFKTHTGEFTLKVMAYELLTKSLLPMPEKWHGLKDKEIRYRKRYLDLIANEEVMSAFIIRTKVVKEIRAFLDERGFMEVETPMMQAIPGGAKARPFKTHHNALDLELHLRIAPELYLKRLIVGGFEKVYEINRNFRNEGISIKHNPEFTMLELYQAYGDFETVMKMCEDIVAHVSQKVLGTMVINYQGTQLDLTPPWKRISMKEAIKEYAGFDFDKKTQVEIKNILTERNIKVREGAKNGELLEMVFGELVEPKLMGPVFITDFPTEISPLAKQNRNNPELAERFEPYIFGRELANGFSELNDPEIQEARFREQIEMDTQGEVAKEVDEDYIEALKYGMPPTGGLGIGIDRLVMFLTDSASIRDVILFPLLRPHTKVKEEEK